ncbi:MAG: ABC transporter substrate-binding protein [Candidatus Diapherotrites archaeon]
MLLGCPVAPENKSEYYKTSARLPIPVWNAFFGGFASALDLNYYADEGLDVTYNGGTPELNPVKMVVSGADDVGILGGPDTLLVARSKGAPIVAIAVLHHDKTFPCIATLKDSGITQVSQLEGKRIGLFYGHISTDIIRALLHQEGVENFTEVDVGGYNYTPLISGQVDAEWCFITDAAINLAHEGVQVNVINPLDYGMAVDGYTIFTREDMIKEHPEVVEKFLRATLKGVEYSLSHEEEAIQFLAKRQKNLDPELERERFAIISPSIFPGPEGKYGIGYMNREMFERAYNRMNGEGLIAEQFDVNAAYTTYFLDRIYGQ